VSPLGGPILQSDNRQHLRHNFTVGVLDGAFFGVALGIASFTSVIPLFIATLTTSNVLIGLASQLHWIGWQLPQLLTANRVAGLTRYKPLAVFLTIHERLPFFGLAIIALLVPYISRELALILTMLMLTWQGLGGGLTATPWQSMINKLMPSDLRGTFYGAQSAAANLMAAGGAVAAGLLLEAIESPFNFALCFFAASVAMLISGGFLSWTREDAHPQGDITPSPNLAALVARLNLIMRGDHNFAWFIVARLFMQGADMARAFLVIYAMRQFNAGEEFIGILTGVSLLAQTVANPLLGWLGDRYSHRTILALSIVTIIVCVAATVAAPSLVWFYLIFGLSGITVAALWTTTIAMNAEFGSDAERPYYIGLGNTLVAPATLAAPLIGGLLADNVGYAATFIAAGICGVVALAVLLLKVREPRHHTLKPTPHLVQGAAD
jgi:MFS family permease